MNTVCDSCNAFTGPSICAKIVHGGRKKGR